MSGRGGNLPDGSWVDRMPYAPRRLRADEAGCCLAKVDAIGRGPIGFCGPDCLRRTVVIDTNERSGRAIIGVGRAVRKHPRPVTDPNRSEADNG